MLGLLASGSALERVDAAFDAPGAPAGGPTITRAAAAMQLQLCARVRKLCAPRATALLLSLPAADATMMVPVPTPDGIDKAVGAFYGPNVQMAADKVRAWAAAQSPIAPLFVPLYRGA